MTLCYLYTALPSLCASVSPQEGLDPDWPPSLYSCRTRGCPAASCSMSHPEQRPTAWNLCPRMESVSRWGRRNRQGEEGRRVDGVRAWRG